MGAARSRATTVVWRIQPASPSGAELSASIVCACHDSLCLWKDLAEATPNIDTGRSPQRDREPRLSLAPGEGGIKTTLTLNKLPKSQQSKAKRALQEVWIAETKKDALVAFDAFVETWRVKYDKAVEYLIKDRDALLAFYDFPAEHWKHLRTTDEMDKRFFHDRDDDRGNRCKSILLFGCAAGHSSVPAIDLAAAARRGGQGWPHLRPPGGLALTGPSTAACWQWKGTAFLACWNLTSAAIMVVGRGRPLGEA
jgi:hypothetical protein